MKYLPVLLLLAALAGCAGTKLSPSQVRGLAQLPYPKSAAIGEDLQVLVERDGSTLVVTNLTAHAYRDMQLWLNQQYVSNVKEVPISVGGKSTELSLYDFIDAHRRSYPVGRFLTPDKGFPVVLAELFDPATGERHRLLAKR